MMKSKDKEILNLFQCRSENAISVTKKKYGRLIRSVAYDMLQNNEDADECENDTYLALWNSIPPAKPDNMKAYCLKITRNQALKKLEYYKAGKRDPSKVVSFEKLLEELSDFEADHTDLFDTDVSDCINDFLGELSATDRKVFILRYWYMFSIKEIMEECYMSESRIKSLLFRLRKELKKRLTERGYYHE